MINLSPITNLVWINPAQTTASAAYWTGMNLNIALGDAIGLWSNFSIFMKFAWRVRMKFAASRIFRRRLFQVHQIYGPVSGTRAFVTIAIICGAIAMIPPAFAWSATTGNSGNQALRSTADSGRQLAQDDSDEDDKDVPTSQVDKYINVYESMQKDHNLTVEQAASKQGLTVAQFRALEGKIEQNDTLRERVRKALRRAGNPKDSDSSDD
jgi:hypothetical protein